jgi:hypothetical protein
MALQLALRFDEVPVTCETRATISLDSPLVWPGSERRKNKRTRSGSHTVLFVDGCGSSEAGMVVVTLFFTLLPTPYSLLLPPKAVSPLPQGQRLRRAFR